MAIVTAIEEVCEARIVEILFKEGSEGYGISHSRSDDERQESTVLYITQCNEGLVIADWMPTNGFKTLIANPSSSWGERRRYVHTYLSLATILIGIPRPSLEERLRRSSFQSSVVAFRDRDLDDGQGCSERGQQLWSAVVASLQDSDQSQVRRKFKALAERALRRYT